jgi:hypothetical protein
MKQEDITRMAREAGLELARFTIIDGSNKLKRFAALVAAAEREACARVCEKVAVDYYTRIGREHEPYMRATAEDCARHIRARGQPEERNFCPRCGKRTADPTTIHTCTPPQIDPNKWAFDNGLEST